MAMAAAAGEEKVQVQEEMERIFVGGLGLGVTEDDLERLFTGVGGKVDGVHIIRTKGRSFAYVDFLPSSQKSLSKLFATYNGCVWKGGKLKLHKAKEHYLIRMKREWAQQEQEEALLASSSVPESAATQQAKLSNTKQLRLFFPALRTVKSLPYSGTGKHKYSFQRVQAPTLPLHFCDCEEHSVSFDLCHHHQPSDHVVIDEKELGIMNKVMAKFLEKETPQDEDNMSDHTVTPAMSLPSRQHDDDDDHFLATEAEDADIEDHQEEEDEDEEDDFIINIVSNSQVKKMVSPLQELRANGMEAHTIANGPPNKKKKSLPNCNYNVKELEAPAILDRKTTIKSHSNESRKLSSAQPEMHVQHSTAPVSWSQKSSWKQLIGGHKDNGGFSVSHILTDGSSSTDNMGLNRGSFNVYHSDTRKQELASNGNLEGKQNEMELLKAIAKHKASKSSESNISGREQTQESSGTQLNDDDGRKMTEQLHSNSSGFDGKNKNLSSDGNLDAEICEMEMMEENAELQPLQEPSNTTKSGRGPSWCQKLSWMQLINDTGSSFSITQILPAGIYSKQQSVPKPTGVDVVSSSGSKLEETVKEDGNTLIRGESSSLGIAAEGNGKQRSRFKENQQIIASTDSACAAHLTPKQAASTGTADKGETCLFVRSDATVKEWRKAKAALSRPRKRKNIEN